MILRSNYFKILFLVLVINGHGIQLCPFPIFYHEQYNFHPPKWVPKFIDFERSKHVFEQLNLGDNYQSPHGPVSKNDLRLVHFPEYLDSLKTIDGIKKIIPGSPDIPASSRELEKFLLTPMRYLTQGTIDATFAALKHGLAINLGGGFHHAKQNSGSGFCCYSDIAIAIEKMWRHAVWSWNKLWWEYPYQDTRVLIVDLDAHQGNGYEDIFCGLGERDGQVAIFDVYNEHTFPYDRGAKESIRFPFPLAPETTTDDTYLSLLIKELPTAIAQANPQLIIYLAGTDILAGDPLGKFEISRDAVIQRDAFVFAQALKNNIPIVMLLAGGYTAESADVIAKSIGNLLKNVLKSQP